MFDLTKQVQAFSDKSPRYIPLDLNSSRHNIPPLEHNLIPFQGWAGAERHSERSLTVSVFDSKLRNLSAFRYSCPPNVSLGKSRVRR
jgi:hypothetical protein